jgi:hypothetical protein
MTSNERDDSEILSSCGNLNILYATEISFEINKNVSTIEGVEIIYFISVKRNIRFNSNIIKSTRKKLNIF